ncbi:MAG: PUR family DNA/RNA-binding protein [Treponemataceae bacterium]|nr:PUR family DNA/RNA-binding protein [Treponemataceae bacterium]
MGVRGELFTKQVTLDNRSYFFNVKENRAGDVFLQVVESKNKEGAEFDRHAIVVFADDMQQFCKGLEESLGFIEKDRKTKAKAKAERKLEKEAKFGPKKKIYRTKDSDEAPEQVHKSSQKRTGKVHVVSKLPENK